jgi:hypothetical protein
MKHTLALFTALLLAPLATLHAQQPRVIEVDLCIYDGTTVASSWLAKDRVAATRWIEQSPLPPEARRQALGVEGAMK